MMLFSTASPIRRFALLWLPVLVWCWFIFHLSSIPYLRIVPGPWDFLIRKVGHFAIYGVLARLLARALTGSTFWSWKRIFVCSLALSMLYAGTDEYHQTFVAGRVGSLHDVAIDSAGAWTALGLWP